MGRAAIGLMLILDMLVCPFACSGSISLGANACADSCCSPKQAGSDNDSPRPSDDGCDGSCKNCLCGGAINDEETSAEHLSAQETLTHVWLPVLTIEGAVSVPLSGKEILGDDKPAFPTGVALRALLQSFVL